MATLLDTNDAMVWAEEFCRIFEVYVVHTSTDLTNAPRHFVDEGTMVGWFANAMAVAESAGRKAMCPHPPEEQIMLADDLSSCRKCGEVFVEPSG
jgi:hypothetical protein